MPKWAPISWQDLVKGLRALGFSGPYPGGKHLFMVRETLRLTIPNPHKREIGIDLLARLLKQANVTKDEWLNK